MRTWTLILRLLIGILLAWGVGTLFLELSEELSGTLLGHVERAVMQFVATDREPGETALMLAVSLLGSVGFFALLSTALAFLFLRRGMPLTSLMILIVTAGSGLLSLGLKVAYNRPRPEISPLVSAGFASFPSGHSLSSVAIYGFLAYLISREVRWYWRPVVWIAYVTLAVMISASRVYLGVHWPTDVIGGILAGTVWLVTCILGYEVLVHLRDRRGRRTTPREE